MQLKRNIEVDSSRKIWFILLVYISLILIGFIYSGQPHWILFVVLFLIITAFSSMLFWQEYILPDLGFAEHLLLAKYILVNKITRSPYILSIRNGEIEGDYLLLKNKPIIKVMNIDHKSAVLIEDSSNQKSLLLNGVNVINKNPRIIGVFYLGIRSIQIGPLGRSDFTPKKAHESQAEYHAQIRTSERTKTELPSGEIIYPAFSILYRFDPSGEKEKDLLFFQKICSKLGENSSHLISMDKVDEFIISQILIKWASFCAGKNLNEILVDFPDTFDSSFLSDLGIKSRITVDRVINLAPTNIRE